MRTFVIALALLAGCAGGPSRPSLDGYPDPLKLEVERFTLKNGLTVLVLEDHRLPVYSLYSFYKVGSKDERPGITGASHFLEHLMFKGTKQVEASKFDYLVEGNGGSSNAYTTNDMTVYHEDMPSSTLELMLSVEADRMVNLVIRPVEFESERQVVLEERKVRYENSPRGELYMRLMGEIYKGTPYGHSVIGDIKDLKTVSRDQVYRYYRQWYAPNNDVLVVVGDVKVGQVRSLVEKYFGEIPSSPVPEASRAQVPATAFDNNLTKPVELKLKGATSNPLFMLGFPGHPEGSAEAFALDILGAILGDGKSAHLVQKFVLTRRPPASSIYASNYTLQKAGIFLFGGELDAGTDPDRFKSDLLKEIKRSCKTAVSERSVRKIKNQYEAGLYAQLDTTGGLAQFVGEREAMHGDWRYYRKEWKVYNALGVAEVRAACEKLAATPAHVWVTVWDKHPQEKKP